MASGRAARSAAGVFLESALQRWRRYRKKRKKRDHAEIVLAACKTLASVIKTGQRRKSLIYRSNCKARTQIDRLDGNTPAAAASGSEKQLQQLNQGQPTIAARRRKHSTLML